MAQGKLKTILMQNFEVTNKEYYGMLLTPEGFRPEAKSRGGSLVTRAYIEDSTYSSNIQSVYQKKSRFA